MLNRIFPIPLRWLGTATMLVLAAATAFAQDNAVVERMKKDVFFLASPECEGRGVGTKGIDLAAEYIVNQIKQAGLKPGAKDGSWFQPFTIGAGKGAQGSLNTLTIKGPIGQTIELQPDQDFRMLPSLGSGKVEAPVIFVGYGLTMPSSEKGDDKKLDFPSSQEVIVSFVQQKKGGGGQKGGGDAQKAAPPTVQDVTWVGYDDFKGVDVKGKIVVILRRVPRWDNDANQFGGDKTAFAGLERKIANCEQNGAAAIIVVNDASEAKDGDKFTTAANLKAAVPVLQLRRSVLDMMLVASKGTTLANLEKDIDIDLKPRSGPLAGWTLSLETNVKLAGIACKNIIGVLEGAGPLANETVVIGAHYDHLGVKGGGAGKAQKMYPGADDNGSGSSTIMEVARRFGSIPNRQGRRLVFIWFSAEERGLLGSAHYCREPVYPLESTVVCMNLDMVGRLKDIPQPELYAEGFSTGKGMEDLLKKLNAEFDFKIVGPHPQNIFNRSDQASFYKKGVPGMFFFTDFHKDYHQPGDTPDKINVAGMAKIAGLAEKIVAFLALTPKRPEYVANAPVKGKAVPGKKKGGKLSLTPDPTDKGDKGILVSAVAEGGPAALAGIKPGDRITAINNLPTPNVIVYNAVLQNLVAGTAVEVIVLRDGKELTLKVTPQ